MNVRRVALFAVLFATGCPRAGEYLEVEPETARLAPGDRVTLVVRHGFRGWEEGDPEPFRFRRDLEVTIHDGEALASRPVPAFMSGRDLVLNPRMASLVPDEVQPGDDEIDATTECGPGDGEYVCVARFDVTHLRPGDDAVISVRFRAGELLSERSVITFVREATVDDAGPEPVDAGVGGDDAGGVDAGGGACGGLVCVNGTRTTDGEGTCRCVCDAGFRGERCERRDPVVSTLPGTFTQPRGLAIDGATLLVVSGATGDVERVGFDGSGRTTLVAGTPGLGLFGVAVADDGTIYVISSTAPRLRQVSDGALVPVPVDVPSLGGIAWSGGSLWLAMGTQVGRLDTRGAPMVEVVAGSPFNRHPEDGVGDRASFGPTLAIAGDATLGLFVGDQGAGFGGALRQLDPVSRAVTTRYGADDRGPNDRVGSGWLEAPAGVAVAPGGGVYVAERGANRVRRLVDLGTPAWFSEDVAGDRWTGTTDRDGEAGMVDGPGDTARFDAPSALAITPDGRTLFVADANNDRVRVIAL